MGTSYETMLVAAEFKATVRAVRDTPSAAVVVPVAAERVAVVPREKSYGVADLHPLAATLSARLRRPVLAMYVFDSDVVQCVVYQNGDAVHRYVSDQAMTVEWFEDDDGEFKPMIDGVVYPPDHVIPKGPLGADADAFVPFAVEPPDLDRIGAALRGEIELGDAPYLMAEQQHWEIMAALGLSPESLTIGHRHVNPADFHDAVVVA
jgi:hypothetical protein